MTHHGRPRFGVSDKTLARWREQQARVERRRRPEPQRHLGRRPYRRDRFVLDIDNLED